MVCKKGDVKAEGLKFQKKKSPYTHNLYTWFAGAVLIQHTSVQKMPKWWLSPSRLSLGWSLLCSILKLGSGWRIVTSYVDPHTSHFTLSLQFLRKWSLNWTTALQTLAVLEKVVLTFHKCSLTEFHTVFKQMIWTSSMNWTFYLRLLSWHSCLTVSVW